jgi:hypothetical protein
MHTLKHSATTWNEPTRSAAWSNRDRRLIRAGGLSGVLGPVLFTASVLAQSALRRAEYNPISEPISGLGAGSLGWVQSATFAIAGLLTIAFAAGLDRGLATTRLSRIGPVLVAVTGVGMLWAAAFPLQRDEAGVLYDPGLHAVGALFFGVGTLAVAVTTVQLFRDERWRSLAPFSAAVTILLLVAMPVAVVHAIPGGAPLHAAGGLVQASIVALRFTWQVVIARHLLRAAR